MTYQIRIVRSILPIALLLALATLPAFSQTPRAELLKQSSIVFVGTVAQKNAVDSVPVAASPQTMVVRVDRVLVKPKAIALAPENRVTVEVKDPSAFNEGTQATFYTIGWIFGKRLAVREVGHEISTVALAADGGNPGEQELSQARQELRDSELRERIQAAEMVVVGRVIEIRPNTIAAAMGATPRRRITEHDPDWLEALIRVESSIKGAQADQEILVRFPGSLDVAWFGVPKFKVNQEGTFILQKDQVSDISRAMLNGVQVDVYTALSEQDVLSKEDAQRVRALAGQ